MTYLPGNRVRLIAAWAPPEWIGALGTVRECASSTLVGAPGMLYLVEWDTLIVERTVMRDDDIESERTELYAEMYGDPVRREADYYGLTAAELLAGESPRTVHEIDDPSYWTGF